MDFKLVEGIVDIEQYGNITEAAKRLYITPSALNQQLLKTEKELGVQLFTRTKRRMVPTAAGTVYLAAARKIMAIRRAAYMELQDLAGCIKGTYRFGLTYDHGSDVFARVYPQFHRQYPGIKIRCYQALAPQLIEMLGEDMLDLAFLLQGKEDKADGIEEILLSEENLLLGLPRDHPLARGLIPAAEPHAAIDMRELMQDSFALNLQRSTMRTQLIDRIFAAAGFHPDIMIESSYNAFLEQLAAQGICDCIVPQSQVRNWEDVAWFYLPGGPRFRFSVAHRRGEQLNSALQYFIALAQNDALKYLHSNPPPEDLTRWRGRS